MNYHSNQAANSSDQNHATPHATPHATSTASSANHGRTNMAGWTIANACIVGLGAWMVFSHAGAPMSQRAGATPPPPSAFNNGTPSSSNNQSSSANAASQALDSGRQREEMVAELRALRQEVSQLTTAVTSGRMRTEVSNLGELKLQIDYAKLREAAR